MSESYNPTALGNIRPKKEAREEARTEKAGDPKVTGFLTDDAVLDSITRRNEWGSPRGNRGPAVPRRGKAATAVR